MNGYRVHIAKNEFNSFRAADRAVKNRVAKGCNYMQIEKELRQLSSVSKLFEIIPGAVISQTIKDYCIFYNWEPATVEPPLFADLLDTVEAVDAANINDALQYHYFVNDNGNVSRVDRDLRAKILSTPLKNYISEDEPQNATESCVETIFNYVKSGGKIIFKDKALDHLPCASKDGKGLRLDVLAERACECTVNADNSWQSDELTSICEEILYTIGVCSLQTYRRLQAAKVREAEADEAAEYLEQCLAK